MLNPIKKDPIKRTYSDEEVCEIILRLLGAQRPGHYISKTDLTWHINRDCGHYEQDPITSRQVRHCIGLLRLQEEDILSTGGIGGGYRLSRTLEEVYEFTGRELRSRAMDLLTKYSRMRSGARKKYGGQMELLTYTDERVREDHADVLLERLMDILEDPSE